MIPIMTGPGLYLARVSLTELSTAGRQSRKQSWQGLDEHVMAAPRRPEPWGLETEKGWRDTQVAAPCEVCRHHHHHHRHPDWGLWFVSRLWLTETKDRDGTPSVVAGTLMRVFHPMWRSEWGDIFPKWNEKSLWRDDVELMLWGQMRRSCLSIKNEFSSSSRVLGGGACGYLVDGPHPISSILAN